VSGLGVFGCVWAGVFLAITYGLVWRLSDGV
jgi:hypothetical protein